MDDLLGLETRALLDLLARRGRGPAVGSAAALVAATAAALVAKAARGSGDWKDAPAAAAQAEALRARTAPLAQADADAYAAAVARLDEPGETDAGRRDFQLGRALDAAALIPTRIAAASADVAALAAEVAEHGNPDLRPEAVGAALLAEAAARTAAHLVAVNLAVGAEDDRVREAEGHAEAAAESARQALST
ncbi:MAG TPA: cyclodeaminase/cyclohydrolase family protein [Gaiellaceae bacterium]|nr:cyclodeaminase/cyclohydrolase family protein [Gaiellaceae bacterium]